LNDALKTSSGLRILSPVGNEVLQLAVYIFTEVALQDIDVDVAGTHHSGRVLVVQKREQEMLQRRVFMPASIG
jgi:hypothetical protein